MRIIVGQKRHKRYKHGQIDDLVGKTVEAVGITTVDGPYGKEPCTMLFFTDGSKHGFVHPVDTE